MKLIRDLLRPSPGVLALSVAAGVAAGASGVGLIALARAELARTGAPSSRLGWSFAALCVVSALARVLAQRGMIRLGQEGLTRLVLRLCRHILRLPLEVFEALDPAALTAVLTEDVVLVANALAGIPQVAINAPIVAACLIYGGWLSPLALGLGVAVAVPAVGGYVVLSNRAMRHLRSARGEQVELVGHFRSLIDGFRELKLHQGRRTAFETEALAPRAEAVRDRTILGLSAFAEAAGWAQVASFGFIGLLVFVLPGVGGVDRATVAGMVLLVLFLMPSLDVLLTWAPVLGRARASLGRIEALVPELEREREAGETESERAIEPARLREAIELEGVMFSYVSESEDRGHFRLGPVDLTLRPGEIVFLVGGNGSGKTTLVKLLSGLYSPHAGVVRLDGRVVRDEDREGYRQLFSVVFADGHLFSTLMGIDAEARGEWAGAYLRKLKLEGKVEVRQGAFSTVDLSVGQKRRLALLAACVEDRPVCVLDEWAAHQDQESRRVFYRELLPELRARGKALLIISHDEEYFDAADRVVRLDGGLIREAALSVEELG